MCIFLIKKTWYIYSMEYYSATKRNEIGSSVEKWIYLESVTNSSSQDQVTYSSFHDQPYFSLFSLRLQERALLHNLVKKIICVRTAYETNV